MAKLGQYNLENMTEQEVFEASANHLIEQGEKSENVTFDLCLYNGSRGECCAAGIFVQNYEKEMEGLTWLELTKDYNQSDKYILLISKLQYIHDEYDVHKWKEKLIQAGERFNLDTSFLKD